MPVPYCPVKRCTPENAAVRLSFDELDRGWTGEVLMDALPLAVASCALQLRLTRLAGDSVRRYVTRCPIKKAEPQPTVTRSYSSMSFGACCVRNQRQSATFW